jgi:hypothetical protein
MGGGGAIPRFTTVGVGTLDVQAIGVPSHK